MTIWKNSKMTILYFDERPSTDLHCIVSLDEREIIVKCDDGEPERYSGKNDGSGHFQLTRDGDNKDKSSLHRFPDSLIMEGYWTEDGGRGMWRIELKE